MATPLVSGMAAILMGHYPDASAAAIRTAIMQSVRPTAAASEKVIAGGYVRLLAAMDYLAGLPGVKRVIYPTRSDHPDLALSQALLKGQGCNMVSFELDGDRAAANAFARAADGLSFAPTLGDVGTTLSHPASSSHRALTPENRAALGISEGFFRVSVGLEDPEALKQVFATAIAEATVTP